MSSYREQLAEINAAIYRGFRAGICDSDGHSVKNEHGQPVKKPRFHGSSVVRRKVYPRFRACR